MQPSTPAPHLIKPVLRQRQGEIEILTLNRPMQRNAMSSALVASLTEALADINEDASVGAILLVGEGRGFCAGSDLGGLTSMTPAQRRSFEAESGRLARMIGQCAKPVVSAVHGFAVGGGLTLATSCDIVVTDAASRWSLPEVPIGLFPAWGLASVGSRIGMPAARRLSWGIETLTGAEAHRLGLADILVDSASEVRDTALKIASQLAALPRRQSEAVKRYFASQCADEGADIAANSLFMEMTSSPEAQASFIRFGS
ncbi:enoyl-CoA hydratase/isomerase family protein [Pseudomonas sp. BF-R-26]|uniref:enoyl-CoA hydratase/isomerase family protein n=1 Tax=Pseudomonas sp. BF-R-26 TaxID=2832398 RepID=UPI001CBAE525|nr:enoyl-CoA hydratase/isomerase family protein [Pseudomonas sp. BF-R-26]